MQDPWHEKFLAAMRQQTGKRKVRHAGRVTTVGLSKATDSMGLWPAARHVEAGVDQTQLEAFPARAAVRWYVICLMVLVLFQAALNIALNPAGAFPTDGYPLFAVRASDSYQKLAALDRFLNATRGSDIRLALGSSRMILMSADSGDDQRPPFFNLAISGGQSEDILAFTRYVLERDDVHVVDVYINVDPSVFDAEIPYGERLKGVYPLESEVTPLHTRVSKAIPTLLSNDWLDSIKEHIISSPPEVPGRFDPVTGVRLEHVVFDPQVQRAGGRQQLYEHHVAQVVKTVDGSTMSNRRIADLREAVYLWQDHGARVELVFMPFAPDLWNRLNDGTEYMRLISTVDRVMIDIAMEPKVTYCDFADPTSVGLGERRFWWDGVHYTGDASAIIFRAIETCAARDEMTFQVGAYALQ